MDSDYDYGYGSNSPYSFNVDYDEGYDKGYDDGYHDGYGDRYDDSDGYDYYSYDNSYKDHDESYRDYIDGYKDYTDSYKHYIDSYEDYINDCQYQDDCGEVLGDGDSTEAVFGDGGCEGDYDYGYAVHDNGLYYNSCGGGYQNPVHGSGVYKNGVYGNEKHDKLSRGVCRNATGRNAIYTNGTHNKVYNNGYLEPENKAKGYIKNDLYMLHCPGRNSHRPTTTSDEKMNNRPRRLDLANETDCSKLCGGRCDKSPKQRMAIQRMKDYGRQNFGFP